MRFPAIPTSVLVNAAACILIGSAGTAFGQECPPEITAPAPLNSNAAEDSGGEFRPQLATDGAGNWVAVWTSYDTLNDTIGEDLDVLFARSVDNGESWSPVAPLNQNAADDVGTDSVPHIFRDDDLWIVVWISDDDLDGTIGADMDLLFSRSVDGGSSWSYPQPLNTNAAADNGADVQPLLASDGDGNWLALWISRDDLGGTVGDDFDIFFARSSDGGQAWTYPQPLNSNAGSDTGDERDFRIDTDGQGNWLVMWSSADDLAGTIGEDYDILVARSTDGGWTWTDAEPLNNNASIDSGADFARVLKTNGSGIWLAVWLSEDSLGGTIGEDRDFLFARSTDNGASWSDPAALNTNAGSDNSDDEWSMTLTSDFAGTWMAAWNSSDDLDGTIGPDSDVLFSLSFDSGAVWTAPQPLNSNAAFDTGDDHVPKIGVDATGDWVAVWTSNDDLGGTIGTDWDILLARSLDGGMHWTQPHPLNTNASVDAEREISLKIADDGAGHWVAIWITRSDLDGTIGDDLDLLFARFQLGSNQNITICHVPPGNSNDAHTITVSENAVPAHLAHGDSCGPCEENDGAPPDGGGNGETESSACPADVDGDGAVNASDLAELLAAWGPYEPCPPFDAADFNEDCGVNAADLAQLLGDWGPCE